MIALSCDASVARRGEPFVIGTRPQSYTSTGLSLGRLVFREGAGGFGSRRSYVRSYHNSWAGLYLDAGYDFAQEAATLSLGPEVGTLMFGLDGGFALRLGAKSDQEWEPKHRPY